MAAAVPAVHTAIRPNLLALTPRDVERLAAEFGWPRHRAAQILRWLYQKRVRHVEDMTDLSRQDRTRLASATTIERLDPSHTLVSDDGTRKYLTPLADGLTVETVAIPEGRRLTVCVSTQVGCTLDCGFCLTGTMGLLRNLDAHEIVQQVLLVQDRLAAGERVSSLVCMGMGEPLANLKAVRDAVERLTHPTWGVGFVPRRITVSTAGLASKFAEAAELGVNLAISLNATTDAQRRAIMPAASRLADLQTIMAACRTFPLPARRRLTFEYVLLAGTNDSDADAARLIKLVRGLRCKINLIAFNEFPGNPYRRPDAGAIARFQAALRRAGLDVFLRRSKGRDVLGACGQLGRLSPRQEPMAPLVTVQGALV